MKYELFSRKEKRDEAHLIKKLLKAETKKEIKEAKKLLKTHRDKVKEKKNGK